jgi:hypothetical protein
MDKTKPWRTEWITPRVTYGNFMSIAAFHTRMAERTGRWRGMVHIADAEPRLPSEETIREWDRVGEAIPVLRAIRRYQKISRDPRSEAKIYWDAKEAFEEFLHTMHEAAAQGHFDDFNYDPATNNFLFRGLNKKGQLVVSVIDQQRIPRRG